MSAAASIDDMQVTLPVEPYTQVAPGLYVGHAHDLGDERFDVVLTLFSALPYAPVTMRERRYNWAGTMLPARKDLVSLAGYLELHWHLLGQTTLVRDLTGLNRPSLIAGLAMQRAGYDHHDVVARLERRSPLALSNPRYRQHLLDDATMRDAP